MASKSPFIPLHVTGKDGAATPEDLNRVQDQIRAAFGRIDAGVTKITSRDGSVILNPSGGTGAVDLSVAFDTEAPGSAAMTIGNGPGSLVSSSPALFRVLVIDGDTYVVPMWKVNTAPAAGMVLTGLKLWTKGDAGVTQSAGKITNWADQSGNGNDLVPHTNAPLYDGTGFASIPAAHFTVADDSALWNSVYPWTTSWSVLVVFQYELTITLGRLVDWNYPTDNIALFLSGSNYSDQWSAFAGSAPLTTTQAYLITFDAGITCDAYINDMTTAVATHVATHPATTGVNLGGLPSVGGQGTETLVTEFAIWDHALTSPERSQLGSYLHGRGYI